MEFVNDPRRAKIAFVLTLCFAIFFFLSSGLLAYFYWQKTKGNHDLDSSKQKVEESLRTSEANLAKANSELTALKASTDASGKSISSLEKQIADNKLGMEKITAYNEFFKYLTSVIKTHSGLDGWTDAEYQAGRVKAQATGSASFVSDVDWAWNRRDIDQITRLVKIFEDISAGVASGLK